MYVAAFDRRDYFAHCPVPSDMAIRICVAVQVGRAVGVSVRTNPASAAAEDCIAAGVRGIVVPSSPRMDLVVTQF
jgi:eukaryotic-like serine/threonine-protein kinase